MAKLFASAGTSFHTSGSEMFSPVQPKAFAMYLDGIVPSLPIAGLETSKAAVGLTNSAMKIALSRPTVLMDFSFPEALVIA
jgi:hypothetical protein